MSKEDIMFIIAIPFLIAWGILEILWFIKFWFND